MNKRQIFNCLWTALAVAVISLPSAAYSAITVNSVSGIWQNVIGGQNVTGVGTNQIRWGDTTPSDNSGYGFVGVAPPSQVVAIDTAFNLGTFTHYNFPIPSGSAISGATLKTSVNLNIDGIAVNGLTFSYNFLHDETPNVAGQCPAGSASVCDDIVKVENNIAQSSVFSINGVDYTLKVTGFDISGGGNTFLTQENQSNSANLQGVITRAVGVPEPATYALLATCLLGCYLVRRRQLAGATAKK